MGPSQFFRGRGRGRKLEAEARPRQQKIYLELASSRGICLKDYISDINVHPHQRHQVCSTVGSKDFKFKSHKLWNILPKEIKLIESVSQFECKVLKILRTKVLLIAVVYVLGGFEVGLKIGI